MYLNSLQLGLALDAAVLGADKRLQAFTAENLVRIFREPYWPPEFLLGLYRPLTTLSFLFNYSILGSGTGGFTWHGLNLLLHAVNAGFVYALARRVIATPRVAWFAAALWALHPVLTDSVTNIAGRADLLAGTAILGGLYWYIRRTADAEAPPAATAAVMFAIAMAGMWSKESAAILPAMMLLWDMTFGEGWNGWKRRVPVYAAAAIAIPIFFLTRPAMPAMVIPTVDNAGVAAGFLASRLTAFKVIVQYFGLLLFPLHLSSDYAYNQVPVAQPGDPLAWLPLLVVAGLLAAVVVRRSKDPVLFLAAGWFGVALLPVSNLVVLIGAIKAERFLYLPAIGFAIVVAVLLERLTARYAANWQRETAVAGVVILGLLGLRTAARNPDWKDDATLWASNLAAAPMNYKVHKNIASALNFRDPRGTVDEVGRHLEIARTIISDLPLVDQPENVLLDIGLNYRLKADRAGGMGNEAGKALYARSLEFLEKARQVARLRSAKDGSWTDYPHLYVNLGIVYENYGRMDDALEAYRYGMRFEARSPYFYNAISKLLSNRGDLRGATLNVLQQWLAGASDPGTLERLRALYAMTPDGACAFVAAGGGMSINPQCPRLREDVCAAGANAMRVFLDARVPEEARKVKSVLLGTYSCPSAPLQAILQ